MLTVALRNGSIFQRVIIPTLRVKISGMRTIWNKTFQSNNTLEYRTVPALGVDKMLRLKLESDRIQRCFALLAFLWMLLLETQRGNVSLLVSRHCLVHLQARRYFYLAIHSRHDHHILWPVKRNKKCVVKSCHNNLIKVKGIFCTNVMRKLLLYFTK